jgi:hypothetical protein
MDLEVLLLWLSLREKRPKKLEKRCPEKTTEKTDLNRDKIHTGS